MVDTEIREKKLRSLIQEKPKNGRALADLSTLLYIKSKAILRDKDDDNNNDDDQAKKKVLYEEAVALAKKSISVAPIKPFGHVALSTVSTDPVERMDSLTRAITLTTDQFRLARIGLLIRSLTEPRDLEARKVKGTIGKASKKHPNRRELDQRENSVYERVKKELDALHESNSKTKCLTNDEQELISKQEFRLGQFFRKKEPRSKYSKYSIQHFTNCRNYPNSSQFAMAGFWLATLDSGNGSSTSTSSSSPEEGPLRCPQEYVIGLYSTFATNFDTLLVEKLNYQTPTKIRKLFDKELKRTNVAMVSRCCDLGCGTGLSGLAFQSVVHSMVGIDLSPEMLDQARLRKCYDSLHVGDVEEALEEIVTSPEYKDNCFDLVLACDVFCYIGDLSEIFKKVHSCLAVDGYFCFSTELLLATAISRNFQLHGNARFCHTKSYIQELVNANGFQICQHETTDIRKNEGKGVKGLLVVLKKVATT